MASRKFSTKQNLDDVVSPEIRFAAFVVLCCVVGAGLIIVVAAVLK